MKNLIDKDILFDKDVTLLLYAIKECKRPGQFQICFLEDFYFLFNKITKIITNSYHCYGNEETNEKINFIKTKLPKDIGLSIYQYVDDAAVVDPSILRNEVCSVIDIQNYDIKNIKKGHRQNIQKCEKLNVSVKIHHFESVEESTIRDFYNSVITSRSFFNKKFEHSYQTFLIRKSLIENGKAILVTCQHEDKISYVFALVSKNNSFYFDSGYNVNKHPYTAHYAQHNLILYLKKLGASMYNLGEISNVNSNNYSNIKNEKIEYYKLGFSPKPMRTIIIK